MAKCPRIVGKEKNMSNAGFLPHYFGDDYDEPAEIKAKREDKRAEYLKEVKVMRKAKPKENKQDRQRELDRLMAKHYEDMRKVRMANN